jgi:hypothetical protein
LLLTHEHVARSFWQAGTCGGEFIDPTLETHVAAIANAGVSTILINCTA